MSVGQNTVPPGIRSRLAAMNKRLYPAHLSYRPDRKTFRFEYQRDGYSIRKTLGNDLELAYERALQMRKALEGPGAAIPVVTARLATLAQWFERYVAERFPNLAAATVESYRRAWGHLAPLHGLDLPKITAERIRSVLDTIEGESAREHAGVFLSVLLKAAVRAGMLSASPWAMGYRKRKRQVRVLSPGQLALIFQAASQSSRPLLALAGFLGLRREEIFGLKHGDVDLDMGLLTVQRTRVWVSGQGVVEQARTKTGEPRVLPLPPVVADYLRPILKRAKPEGYLFPAFRSDLPRRLRAACRRAGVEAKLTLHDLRHICGSNLMMSGGLPVAQAVLGHKDIGTTADVYGHLTAAHLARHLGGEGDAGQNGEKGEAAEGDFRLWAEIERLARRLSAHRNPKVARLAGLILRVCPGLPRGAKKPLTKNA